MTIHLSTALPPTAMIFGLPRNIPKYNASDFEFLDEKFKSGEWSAESGEAFTCDADSDVNKDAPICIGMDYNANINWIVAGQPDGRRLNVIKSFYVKFERKIPEVVDDFCTYYASHRNKTVVYYYDATALGSNYAVNEQDFRWVVVHDCSCQRVQSGTYSGYAECSRA